jgi:hypothetical protein
MQKYITRRSNGFRKIVAFFAKGAKKSPTLLHRLAQRYVRGKMKIFYLLFILLPFQAGATGVCQLTEEYEAVRAELRKMMHGGDNDYSRCKKAADHDQFWRAMSKCVEAGDGKNVGGGCAHLIGRGHYEQPLDAGHCDTFKFEATPELEAELLEKLVKQKGIKKCKEKNL